MPGGTGQLVSEPVPSGIGILETTPAPPAVGVLGQSSWVPSNNGGIDFDTQKQLARPSSLWETDGYQEHLSDEDGWSVERTYLCNWSDALAAMQWLKGFSVATVNGISRQIPAQDPYRPWMYCTHAHLVEPIGVPLQDAGMEIPATVWAEKYAVNGQTAFADGVAKIRATFRALPYVVRNDVQQANSPDAELQGELCRYVERVPRYAIQGIQLANIAADGQLKFVSDGVLVPEAGVLLMPTASWHYIWHDVPFYPAAAIEAVVGKVNALPFDGIAGWPLLPAQTVLCQSPEIHMARNCIGQASFRITWVLDYRPQGWNAFPRSDTSFETATFGGVDPVLHPEKLVFKLADFRLLFAPGQPVFFN